MVLAFGFCHSDFLINFQNCFQVPNHYRKVKDPDKTTPRKFNDINVRRFIGNLGRKQMTIKR